MHSFDLTDGTLKWKSCIEQDDREFAVAILRGMVVVLLDDGEFQRYWQSWRWVVEGRREK